jgi:hypothetical protein
MISVIIGTIIAASITLGMCGVNAATAQREPSINATSLFDRGQMVLPNTVKHLIILIPNEGHHGPGEEDEARFIGQPFVPQNAIVGPGTQVVWYNGVVGHEHNIVVSDDGVQLFETGDMRGAGFGIDSTHAFTDLRGGQEDTGDEQVLVVWTAAGKNLEEIALRLGEVSEGLPYE